MAFLYKDVYTRRAACMRRWQCGKGVHKAPAPRSPDVIIDKPRTIKTWGADKDTFWPATGLPQTPGMGGGIATSRRTVWHTLS